tara:strand:- start:4965 stop:6821 length:1857 start_codon:yes stop_codon:yes gene_type:complete
MAFVVNDRVKETTTDTGTTTIDLAGAETGFETFVAGIGSTNQTYYCIQAQGGSAFEIGVGTVTSGSPDTLSRTSVISSSNADGLVDFGAGTKDVFCTLPASKAVIEDNSTNANIAGNLTLGGTVDGVDIAARDAVLTSTTTTANAALPKAGGTMSGNLVLSGANITMSGSETVDGVDISARDSVLTSTTTTANAALPKAGGTMTGDIAHSGNFAIDVANELTLDSDDGVIRFKDGGTQIGSVANSSSDLVISNATQDKDIKFNGNDGGTGITALTLDMSAGGALVVASDVKYPDNGKAIFGAGSDLQIFHQSSDSTSKIVDSAGIFKILGDSVRIRSSDDSKASANFNAAGAIELHHNNVLTVQTSANGLEIPADNLELRIGAGADLKLFHNGNDSYVRDAGTGNLRLEGNDIRIANADSTADYIRCTNGGNVEILHNNSRTAYTDSNSWIIEAGKDLALSAGTWTGETGGKIQRHSNHMYFQTVDVGNFIYRNQSGTEIFTIAASNGAVTSTNNITAFSDLRLKKDVKTIENALDKVCKLRGVEYTRKSTDEREIGVIAQEVKEIVPELVTIQENENSISGDGLKDIHTMKYQNTVGLLIEAIKDLKAEVEELKKAK